EHQFAALQRAGVCILRGRARRHGFLAGRYMSERGAAAAVRREQAALVGTHADRAVDIAEPDILAAPDAHREAFENAARLIDRGRLTADRDMISGRCDLDAEAPFEESEILVVAAEYARGEPVVVERQYDLGRRASVRGRTCHATASISAEVLTSSPNRLLVPLETMRTRATSPIESEDDSTCTG